MHDIGSRSISEARQPQSMPVSVLMSRHWNFLGEYIGSCGGFGLTNVFMSWKAYTSDALILYAQQTWTICGLQEAVDEGILEAFGSLTINLSDPEDNEDGPRYDWPGTDDGF